jgi:hypothetical protein
MTFQEQSRAWYETEPGGPFRVHYGYGDTRDFHRFGLALSYLRAARDAYALTGDGCDFDCDEDGYFMCSDGLTDEQREQVYDS